MVILRVKPGDDGQTPQTASASSSLSSKDDPEEGSLSLGIVSKFIPVGEFVPAEAGRPVRRRAHCEQLSFRRRSDPTVVDGKKTVADPAAFRSPSAVMASSYDGDLPESIQFYPPTAINDEDNSSSPRSRKCDAMALIVLIGLGVLVFLQRSQLSALRSEVQMSSQHREYMEMMRTDIINLLENQEQSIDRYRHSHEELRQANDFLSDSMRTLQEDHTASVEELDRLRALEKRLEWSEGRWEKYMEWDTGEG
mmetsp:Transcript_4441/g.9604  ORF Transcript_4441/g.9604 Transcript_4441/m.9604 type:complete len:252 (+) Transcript_4441:86-841(+)|eukprot:CAMPEP_0172549066 /NCGR_PEP_ID=MMETSP1067-20121228/18241_1 /TAXON_ID=265564 ORGANISM="Thalassiosira punctigera, Strain Tpunct2005C2" /NCGR_SAMPLE_ID=MMETSP1067 /ASSEMBLY_ACC=CAM_ASM_000444 /LENGTH=251 /DNA_ID=CAMNT_0013336389 /DNA_START=54 /DNA_END=809 /DNA_ORIENTATION=-